MNFETIRYERDAEEAFVRLTLNRPDSLNAMDGVMIAEIDDAIRAAVKDPEVNAILISGEGRAFCAGYDMVKSGGPMDGERWHDFVLESCIGPLYRLWTAPLPTVAAVHGHVLGGGLELMCCCDLAIAAEDARLGAPEIRHISAPPTLMLPWVVGTRHTRYLMYTGDMISGAEAERMQLVNRAVPANDVMEHAERLTTKLSRIPVPAIKFNKAAINHAQLESGLYNSWLYNAETTALVHTGEEGLGWLQMKQDVGLREFLRRREEPFIELDRADQR